MSCAESDSVCAVSTNKKRGLEREEDDNGCSKIPCIDFQPDERWHVKDEPPKLRFDIRKGDKTQNRENAEDIKSEDVASDNEDSLSSDSESQCDTHSLPEIEKMEEAAGSKVAEDTSKLNGELFPVKDVEEGNGSRELEEQAFDGKEFQDSPNYKSCSTSEKNVLNDNKIIEPSPERHSVHDAQESHELLPEKRSMHDDKGSNVSSPEQQSVHDKRGTDLSPKKKSVHDDKENGGENEASLGKQSVHEEEEGNEQSPGKLPLNDDEAHNELSSEKHLMDDDEATNHVSSESSNDSSDNLAVEEQQSADVKPGVENVSRPSNADITCTLQKATDNIGCAKPSSLLAKELEEKQKPANSDLDSFSADTSCSANSDNSSLNLKKGKQISECSESSTDSFSESDDAKKVVPDKTARATKDASDNQIITALNSQKATLSVSDVDKINTVVSSEENGKPSSAPQEDHKDQALEEEYERMAESIKVEAKFPKAFEGVVKIGLYIPMKVPKSGDFKLAENEAVLESPSHVAPLLLKRNTEFPPRDEKSKLGFPKPNSGVPDYFNNSVGQFLMGLGLSRAKEWHERDLVHKREKQLRKEGRAKALDEEYKSHLSAYNQARQANDPFTFSLKRCEICDFRTESAATLEGHRLVPHLTARREFRCSFCQYTTRDPQGILFHMEAIHNKTGVIEPLPLFYECPVCFYETHLKTKATSHINKCQRYFNSVQNQAPPDDFEYPTITAKPITVEDIKRYDMYLTALTKSRSSSGAMVNAQGAHGRFSRKTDPLTGRPLMTTSNIPLYQQLASSALGEKSSSHIGIRPRCPNASPCGIQLPPGLVITRAKTPDVSSQVRSARGQLSVPTPANQIYQVVSSTGEVLPVLNNNSVLNTVSQQFSLVPSSIGTCLVSRSERGPQPVALVPNVANGGISITRLPTSTGLTISRTTHSGGVQSGTPLSHTRLQAPNTVQSARQGGPGTPSTLLNNSTFVICEICDGYIKDLEQLRTHMLLIHKVKIHPKMLASRPPLNCQKCQWRFFTDQGLERHLLGAHGLVTSNMQEMANTNQDGGRCTVCGRVFVCKLVAHMSQVHKVTLKPAHLSYKCTVCSATFNLYKLFESHVYMVHSGAVKRSSEETNGHQRKKLASEQSLEEAKQSLKVKIARAEAKYETIVPTKDDDDDDMSTKDDEDNESTKDDDEETASTKDEDNASTKDDDSTSVRDDDKASTKGDGDKVLTKEKVSTAGDSESSKDESTSVKGDLSVKDVSPNDDEENVPAKGEVSKGEEDKVPTNENDDGLCSRVPEAPEEPDESSEENEIDNTCPACGLCCDSMKDHLEQKHTQNCCVKLCRIEKCEKCLCSFDGMVVLHTSDFDMGEDEDEEEEEEEEERECEEPSNSNDIEPTEDPKEDLKEAVSESVSDNTG